ncbi:MAG: hypothetical protein IT338_17220 [Thermomicrobiales bacterium]|nr:hypothetical protein [Thermomicrobiales bacterium]
MPLPPAYNNCPCACHRTPNVVHVMACCAPGRPALGSIAAPGPIIRTAINLANGRRQPPGSTAYYRFAAQARSYPFQWHGWPGGVPGGQRAAETRELSGGDLYESGLSPYQLPYPPLRDRNFQAPAGFVDDLSDSEKKALVVGAVGLAALVLLARRRNKGRGRRDRVNYHVHWVF